jgi:hypothetical protein
MIPQAEKDLVEAVNRMLREGYTTDEVYDQLQFAATYTPALCSVVEDLTNMIYTYERPENHE